MSASATRAELAGFLDRPVANPNKRTPVTSARSILRAHRAAIPDSRTAGFTEVGQLPDETSITADAPRSPVAGRITISKSFSFSASHELRLLPATHKCARNHGHNYVVTVTLTADRLDPHGFVTDFGDLAPFRDYLASTFDHRFVNDQVDFHPTCELLAEHLGCWFIGHVEPGIHGRLVSMTVSETQTSSATWHRGAP